MSRLRRLDNSTKAALLHVADEISIHSSLRHPGCIGFESWFSDRLTGKLVLVLEYAKHGSLRHVMRQLRESEAAGDSKSGDFAELFAFLDNGAGALSGSAPAARLRRCLRAASHSSEGIQGRSCRRTGHP